MQKEEEQVLYNIAELWHITNREVDDILRYYKEICLTLKPYKFKNKQKMAYALYAHIMKHNYSYVPQDIKYVFDLKSVNILFKIQTALNDQFSPSACAFTYKFITPLSLSYKEHREIEKMCNTITSDINPKSLASLVVTAFCTVRKMMTEKEIIHLLKVNKVPNYNIRSIISKNKLLYNNLQEKFTLSHI